MVNTRNRYLILQKTRSADSTSAATLKRGTLYEDEILAADDDGGPLTLAARRPREDYDSTDDIQAHVIDVVSEDISTDKGYIYPTTSAQRPKRPRLSGGISVSGEIQVPLYPRGATSLLYYGLGQSDGSEVGSLTPKLYEHTMKTNTTLPFFNAWVGKDLKEHEFRSGVVKSLTVDFEVGEAVLLTADCMFRREMLQTLTALDGAEPWTAYHFPDYNVEERAFSGTEITTSLGGTAIDTMESASIEIANTVVEDNFVLGDEYLPYAFVQEVEVSGSVSMSYTKSGDYEGFVGNNAGKALSLKGQYGTTDAADHRLVEFKMPSISFDTASLPTEGSDRFILEFEFMAELTGTNTSPITVINRNSLKETLFES